MQQYKVSELTDKLKKLIEGNFPGLINITGETGDLSRSSNGHIYFTLKDEGAKIKAVYFRQYIRSDSFIPKNGDKVSVIGELRSYPPEGTYQIIVRKVIYGTEGEFWKKFEETKRKLEQEGLFNQDKKRPLPEYPKRIALLTAATGAAVKDFIITSKNAGSFFSIHLWPIPVQGKDAAHAIASAIKAAGGKKDLYDILVLTRGGGSLDDLSVFNDEVVARALASSCVPTVSAIGHEQDVTISDFVADERVATPTAAAERLSRSPAKASVVLNNFNKRILTLLRFRRENATLEYDRLMTRLGAAGPKSRLETERARFKSASNELTHSLRAYSSERSKRLDAATGKLMVRTPKDAVIALRHRTELFLGKMDVLANNKLTSGRHKLQMLAQRLEMAAPDRLLSMGYALVLKNGRLVNSIQDVTLNDELEISLRDGQIDAFVTGKRKKQQ